MRSKRGQKRQPRGRGQTVLATVTGRSSPSTPLARQLRAAITGRMKAHGRRIRRSRPHRCSRPVAAVEEVLSPHKEAKGRVWPTCIHRNDGEGRPLAYPLSHYRSHPFSTRGRTVSRNHNKTDARHWWRSIRHSAKQALRSGREPNRQTIGTASYGLAGTEASEQGMTIWRNQSDCLIRQHP